MLSLVSIDRPLHRGTARFVLLLLTFLVLRLAVPRAAAAQTSAPAPVALTMTVGESVTLSNVPNTLAFNYTVGGGNTNVQSFAVTSTWQLASTRTALHLVFYFANANALTLGTTNIPTSQFFLDSTATPTHNCADNVGDPLVPASQGHNGACQYGKPITIGSTGTGTETDTVFAQLQGLSASLPAGNYAGTLVVQAGWN
jgi:hypothetical protein